MADEQYNVRINGDYRSYEQSTAGAVTATDQLTSSLGRLAVGLGGIAQKANQKLTLFSAGEVATITGLTVAAARYDQQTSQLQAHQVMLNKSTNAYKTELNGVRTSMGLTTSDSIALMTQLSRMNVPFSQQQAQAKEYVKLAAVTGDSVQGLAASQTMFMRQIDPNQGGKNVERYASTVANLNAKMGASAQGTLDFANSIAPLSRSMGMSAQEILGISGSFSKAGQDGYAAGTVYTKVLTDVNRAIQYGSPEIKVYSDLLGTTVDQFKNMPKAEVVTRIFEALNKEGPQAIKTLDRLGLDGVRSQRAISAVLQQGGLREGIAVANQGFGNTDRYEAASAKALRGTNDNLAKARESLTGFGQAAGGVFLPATDKITTGIVTMLRPLNAFSDLLTKAPVWAKDIGALAAGFAVLAPLVPRLMLGLAGASVLPMLAKGSLGQGFLQGLRPDKPQSAAQAAFARGEGSRGYRGFYRASMFVGDRLNFGGRGGNLSDVDFQGPDGEAVNRRSNSEYTRDFVSRLGLIDPEVGERRRATNERNGRENRSMPTRAANRVTGFLGDFGRSQLRPWNVDYQQNSARDSMRNPDTLLGNARDGFSKLFSKEGFENNLKQVKEHSSALRTAATEARTNTIQSRADFRDTHGVFRNLAKEAGSLGLAGAKAGVGVGYAGVRAGGNLIGRGLTSTVGLMGGAAGVGLMGAAALGGAVYQGFQTRKEARQDDGVDNSAGSDYRNALGLASKATKSFADVIAASATQMNTTVSSVQTAINVTADDIKKAAGRTDQIVDANIKTMNLSQAQTYAGAVLPGADPKEVQALKYDLVAKFGGDTAQSVLNKANSGEAGNLFGLVDGATQTVGSGMFGLYNDLYATKKTAAAGQMVADTAKTSIGRASVNEGSEGVGRMQQSLLNQYVSQQVQGRRNGESGRMTDPVNAARYGALSQAMGLDEKDKASQAALQKVIGNLSREDLSGAALDEAITNQLGTNLGGTDIGAKRAQAQQMGGVYKGTGYMVGDAKTNPFGMLGGTLDTLRTTSLGQRVTGDLAANAPARTSFEAALNNEGNADMQGRAVRDALDNSLRTNKGNFDAVNAEMVNFKNNAGAASSQSSVLADAMIEAAQNARGYANAMGGGNTLTNRMGQAQNDFAGAQEAYRQNPDAPGAFQRVEDTRKGAEATNVEATQRLNEIAAQYRSLDIQREQGAEQLAYGEQRAREDYYRQASYAEDDFARQRGRNAYSFALQQSRSLSDFNMQRARAEGDYQRSKRRQEADFNHQLVVMAEQSARQIYDVYTRVTVARTMSGSNLLENMADQQKKIDDQQANLAAARKMGLSNKAISQMGLNESANAQQLERLVSDMAEDPKMAAAFNAAAKKRQKGAGDLTKDPSNKQYTEMVRAQKLATERADEDFSRSMARQRRDFNTSVGRMRKDYATQMGQASEDFALMRDRQRRQMEIGFTNQRKDFARQMKISEENISTFAEDISLSFDQAVKVTSGRTKGETRKQITSMAKLLDQYQTLIVGKNNDVKGAVKGIYSEFGGSFYKDLTEKQVVKNTSANLGYDIGGYHDGGPTKAVGEYQVAGVVHGGEHVATKKEVDSTPGGHTTWQKIRAAVREGNTGFLHVLDKQNDPKLPGFVGGGAVLHRPIKVGGNPTRIHGSPPALDFGTGQKTGYPVAAGADGKVTVSKDIKGNQSQGYSSYGRYIVIDHGDFRTLYAHLSQRGVGVGAKVEGGQVIGLSGDTGNSTGPHLHFGASNGPSKYLSGSTKYTGSSGNVSGNGVDAAQVGLAIPRFADLKAVKAHAETLSKMGMFNVGGLTDKVLPALMTKRFIDMAVDKFGKDVFNSSAGASVPLSAYSAGGSLKGVTAEQLKNAATIATVGSGMGPRAQSIGIATAIVESGLRNLKYGDRDSVGLFQQRAPWGSFADRTNPTRSAGMFYHGGKGGQRGLDDIKGWQGMDRGRAAQAVQVSAFPGRYAQEMGKADRILSSLKSRKYANGSDSIPEGWGITGENGPELTYFGQGGKVRNNQVTMHTVLKSKAAQAVTPQTSGPVTNNNRYDHSSNLDVGKVEVYAADMKSFQEQLEAKARRTALTTPRPRSAASA